jgi:hypothetical protein
MNRPYFLQYDIPKTRGVDAFPNPSDALWRARCVRITQSCWLIMEANLHNIYILKNDMINAGCRVFTVPFDVSGADELRAMALENIRREIAERMAEAETTRATAEERFDNESDTDYRARRARYLAAARSIEKRIKDRLALIGPAAESFGISRAMLALDATASSVGIIAENMRERAATFAAAHGILTRSRNSGAQAVRKALRKGEMQPEIAADWLCDNDEWNAGEALRTAFLPSF